MRKSFESVLRSRVAQRLFVLFLFAALVPAAGLGLIAYHQVSNTLIDLNYQRLQKEAKSIGMGLVQRLMWREEALRFQSATLARSDQMDIGNRDDLGVQANWFRSLEIIKPQKFATLSSEQRAFLSKSKSLLQLSPDGVAIMTSPREGSPDYLRARLEAEALWNDESEGGNYCVLTLSGHSLYCSPGMPQPSPEHWSETAHGQHNSGIFAWQVKGEDHLAAFWHVSLQANLAHEGLVVVVSDTRTDVLAMLAKFRQLFPAIAILAMALAAWFAISQIRRQMRPLERLESHTRQLALGDFASRIEVSGNDEFASLADSFNSLSDNLNHKFHLLKALGELDRAITSISTMDSVISLLLQHLPTAVSCDEAGVLRCDSAGNTWFWPVGGKPVVVESASAVPESRRIFSCLERDGSWFDLDLLIPEVQCLGYLTQRGATQALVFPARVDNRLDSALVLAYRQEPQEKEDIIQAGCSFADRLTSAAISILWGDKLYHQAHFDSLTDLPNRTLLRDRVEQALLRAERENLAVALMVIDLDKFKDINDSLGHAAGDALLVHCAQQLKKIARHTDTIARLGGDEFFVLISDLPRAGAVAIVDRIASNLSAEIARPVDLGTGSISAPASIGIAMYPENGLEIHQLMKNADVAMYKSKSEHYGSYRFYSDEMNVEIKLRFQMMQDLRKAFDNQEFLLVYQPKIEAASGRLVGAEALIRWASPRLGLISPALFIPLVEEMGLESRLGEWVINTACAQMAAWDAQGLTPIPVSVNASPAQFLSNEIVIQVRAALSKNSLAATRLELEILESTAVGGSEIINRTLTELREMKVGIALDDFGMGYSSLVYLTNLPANVLKIDRGFITDLLTDKRKQTIVAQIILLAKALDFQVIAEGVETEGQAQMLAAMDCDVFQGYFFSKPLEPAAFSKFQKETEAQLVKKSISFPVGLA